MESIFREHLPDETEGLDVDVSPHGDDLRFLDPLKKYDIAIYRWLKKLYVRRGESVEPQKVTVVRSGGEKAYLVREKNPDGTFKEVDALKRLRNNRTAVPIIAFRDLGPPEFDVERYKPHAGFDRNDFTLATAKGYVKDDKKQLRMSYRDIPININYTFDIWCRYMTERNQIHYWIAKQFNKFLYFQVDHNYSYLTTPSWRESSDYEPGEKSRLIRIGFESTFKHCWMPVGEHHVNTVQSVQSDFDLEEPFTTDEEDIDDSITFKI